MFIGLQRVGNDLDIRGGVITGSCLIYNMTVAGGCYSFLFAEIKFYRIRFYLSFTYKTVIRQVKTIYAILYFKL